LFQIITFDEYGISSHQDHIATHKGIRFEEEEIENIGGCCTYKIIQSIFYARHLLANWNESIDGQAPVLYELTTVNIVRKYAGVVDALLSVLIGARNAATFLVADPLRCYRAMCCHASQFVWFRYAFVLFSRYPLVNNLIRIEPRKKEQ
jgi:N-acetylglucosaminylphosphatidylinositol deacetylase